MLNECIRRYFFPSRAKETKKQKKKIIIITPDLRLPNYKPNALRALQQRALVDKLLNTIMILHFSLLNYRLLNENDLQSISDKAFEAQRQLDIL